MAVDPRTPVIVGVGQFTDNNRFLAMSEDEDLVALLSDDDPIGARITVSSTEHGNRASLS